MKVVTVLGTRPEIIRLSRVIPQLDAHCDHVLINTGQNYDPKLSEIFFRDLDVRPPDYSLDVRGAGFGEQVGQLLTRIEPILRSERPDRLLVLGDTNSGLAALVAKRLDIPIFHMEAGNRCYDDRVPEETNRRLIDHSSDILMPYTERSRMNLLREGIAGHRIFVTGNPIREVIEHYQPNIDRSSVFAELGLEKGHYFLVTMHRAENVDKEDRLRALTEGLERLHREYGHPIICSTHPRTKSRLAASGLLSNHGPIRFIEPLGLYDFLALERAAFCVLSDSGTVQEECCLFGVPTVTLRDVTERPETLECGSNMLSGSDPTAIVSAVRLVCALPRQWAPPREYTEKAVSATVLKILLGFNYCPR